VLYEVTSKVFFMSTFIDTPNPIFYSLLSVLCHLAFKFIYILSYFNQAAGNRALDGSSLTPPLPPRRVGRRNRKKGKLMG